jgi:hypothetical protein
MYVIYVQVKYMCNLNILHDIFWFKCSICSIQQYICQNINFNALFYVKNTNIPCLLLKWAFKEDFFCWRKTNKVKRVTAADIFSVMALVLCGKLYYLYVGVLMRFLRGGLRGCKLNCQHRLKRDFITEDQTNEFCASNNIFKINFCRQQNLKYRLHQVYLHLCIVWTEKYLNHCSFFRCSVF